MAHGKPISTQRTSGYVVTLALSLALGLAALPQFAARGAEPSSPAAGPCQTEVTQTDLNICFEKRRQAADTELGRRYDQLMARLAGAPKTQELLRNTERAWIRYRDADCALVASATAGGSAQPMVLAGCLADRTHERIDRLDSQLTCKEGDLSCIAPAN